MSQRVKHILAMVVRVVVVALVKLVVHKCLWSTLTDMEVNGQAYSSAVRIVLDGRSREL